MLTYFLPDSCCTEAAIEGTMSGQNQKHEIIVSRWYFGGLASAGACCVTHPLDLLKVHFQTEFSVNLGSSSMQGVTGIKARPTLLSTTVKIIKSDGVFALYNGLSASLLRQLTYSTTRFGMYEVFKQQIAPDGANIPLYKRIFLAGVSGAAGGIVGKFCLSPWTLTSKCIFVIGKGTPADMINVRMQNDIKLPPAERRNYKNAIDGLIKVYRFEGVKSLFNGATMATSRAIMMTIGQVSLHC